MSTPETVPARTLVFSPEGQRILDLANEEAKKLNHNYVGTEHILLGLAQLEDNEVALLLHNMGADASKIRSAIEFIVGKGDETQTTEPQQTPRAKKVLEFAHAEANKDGTDTISPVHLLSGLIGEGEGIGASVLESMGVSYYELYTGLLNLRFPEIQKTFPAVRELIAVFHDSSVDDRTKNQLAVLISSAIHIIKGNETGSL